MNQYYFNTIPLLTLADGRSVATQGVTGNFSGVGLAREITIVTRVVGSGAGQVTIQGKSPFDSTESYNIVQMSLGTASGYFITGITLPHTDLRAVITGSGSYNIAALVQN